MTVKYYKRKTQIKKDEILKEEILKEVDARDQQLKSDIISEIARSSPTVGDKS